MKNKTIITTDGKEQVWLDTFNEYNHTNYELNQEIEPSQIEQLNDKVIAFNHMVAFGPAIQLEVIQTDKLKMRCEICEKPLNKGDDYIEFEDDRYCGDCYEGYTNTTYTVGGEFLASDDDGVLEYNKYNLEEEK